MKSAVKAKLYDEKKLQLFSGPDTISQYSDFAQVTLKFPWLSFR